MHYLADMQLAYKMMAPEKLTALMQVIGNFIKAPNKIF